MSDAGALRPGYFAPDAGTDEFTLTGLPANIGHESDPFSVWLAELSRRNSEALVRSATGADLDEDLTVTEGHQHNTRAHSIDWQAVYSVTLLGDNSTSTGDREGALLTENVSTVQGLAQIAVPLNDEGEPLYRRLVWRARVRVPATGYTSCELSLRLRVQGYDTDGLGTDLGDGYLSIGYDVESNDNLLFIEGSPVPLNPANLLAAAPEGHLMIGLYGHVSAEAATVFEIQLGWQ